MEDNHREEYNKFMKKYHEDHACCPKCGAKAHSTTLIGFIFDSNNPGQYKDLNRCECVKCGDIHTCHDRISESYSIQFPIIKKIKASLLGDSLSSEAPREKGKVVDSYVNHWGNLVEVFESGLSWSTTREDHRLPGDYGHDFAFGWYIIDDDGTIVYRKDPRYQELYKEYSKMHQIMEGLQKAFPDYRVERGRGDRLVVNDKIIKGILIYKNMRLPVDVDVKLISDFIQADIDSGRIIKGKYGR